MATLWRTAGLTGVLGTLLVAQSAWAVPERGLDPTTPLAEADEDNTIPDDRLYYSSATFARYNPLGLISVLNLGWRHRLMKSDSRLFNDTYSFLGMSARMSPAFGRIGAHMEVQPIAIFKAWVDYEFVGYFGSFDQIAGFSNAGARYSDQTLSDRATSFATYGNVLTFGGVLQAAVGPVAIRSTFQATRYDLRLEDANQPDSVNHAFFYDQYWDRLAPNRDFMFLNDLDLLGLISDKVKVGVRWTWTDALVGDNDTDAGLAQHRVGPLFAYTFHDRGPGARFNKPTVFVMAQWWAQHPYRTGDEQPGGLPLIAAGFAFQGDLLGERPDR